MAASKDKAQYAPPASQVDLEARLESGNASDRYLSTSDMAFERQAEQEEAAGEDTGRPMTVEGNDTDGYVAVDPIYANYANETEAPLESDDEENPENKLFAENFGQLPTHSWEISEETKSKLQAASESSAAGEVVSDGQEPGEVPPLPTPNSADNPS
jgi:hypothetical protein